MEKCRYYISVNQPVTAAGKSRLLNESANDDTKAPLILTVP